MVVMLRHHPRSVFDNLPYKSFTLLARSTHGESLSPMHEATRSHSQLESRREVAASNSSHGLACERHFRPEELAELWGLSGPTIRSLFACEAGVLLIDRPEQMHKRRYRTMRIPASVAERVHARLATATTQQKGRRKAA